MVELNNEEIKCITLFEQLTGALAQDCLLTGDWVAFIVKEGDLGRAIGKGGSNINRVRTAFKGKRIAVVEDSPDLKQFIKNLYPDILITNINIHEKINSKIAYIRVNEKDRGSAIGRNGEKIKLNRAILLRRFGCDLRLASK